MPAIRPWWSACLPSVAETCDCEISSSLIGSAPVFSRLARSWARLDREAARDLRAVAAVDAVRVLAGSRCTGRVISSLSSTTAKCWKDSRRRRLAGRGELLRLAALGDLARDVLPRLARPCR